VLVARFYEPSIEISRNRNLNQYFIMIYYADMMVVISLEHLAKELRIDKPTPGEAFNQAS